MKVKLLTTDFSWIEKKLFAFLERTIDQDYGRGAYIFTRLPRISKVRFLLYLRRKQRDMRQLKELIRILQLIAGSDEQRDKLASQLQSENKSVRELISTTNSN